MALDDDSVSVEREIEVDLDDYFDSNDIDTVSDGDRVTVEMEGATPDIDATVDNASIDMDTSDVEMDNTDTNSTPTDMEDMPEEEMEEGEDVDYDAEDEVGDIGEIDPEGGDELNPHGQNENVPNVPNQNPENHDSPELGESPEEEPESTEEPDESGSAPEDADSNPNQTTNPNENTYRNSPQNPDQNAYNNGNPEAQKDRRLNDILDRKGGEQGGSLPSSDKEEAEKIAKNKGLLNAGEEVESVAEEEAMDTIGKGIAAFFAKHKTIKWILIISGILLVITLIGVLITSVIGGVYAEFSDAIGISELAGLETGELKFEIDDKQQKDYLNRVYDVYQKYQKKSYIVDPLKVVATFHVLQKHNTELVYDKITTPMIEQVTLSLFDHNGLPSEDAFRDNLIKIIIPEYFPQSTEEERNNVVDEIYKYIEDYYSLIGKDKKTIFCDTGFGSCSYEMRGIYVAGKGNISSRQTISSVYVRQMECGNTSVALQQPVIPLEKYILGVVYASMDVNAPADAIKAEAIVLRNNILGQHVGQGGFRTLKLDSDKWIIQVSSCQTEPYCDPDKGCTAKKALDENTVMRRSVKEVEGVVFTNSQGYIVYPNYTMNDKNAFVSLAKNKGLDYRQIILQYYNQGNHSYGATNITKNTCTSLKTTDCGAKGKYVDWKQTDPAWSSVPMGDSGKTIGQIGCLVTSVSMQIARSGVETKITNFNPGTFVQFLNQNGGFSSGGNFIWASATKIAPTFRYQGMVRVSGMSQQEKLAKISELVNMKDVYVVAEVKGSTGQHWVAIDSVTGGTIKMMDPGSKSGNNNMWSKYNWQNTSTLAYYKVG